MRWNTSEVCSSVVSEGSWNTGRRLPRGFRQSMACPRGFRHFRAYGGGGWGGGGGGIRTSFILRPCPKHWFFQRFRLFVQHMQACGTRTMPFATMPKTPVFTAFYAQNTDIYSDIASSCKHTVQGCGTRSGCIEAISGLALLCSSFSICARYSDPPSGGMPGQQ